MEVYKLNPLDSFEKSYLRLIKKNNSLAKKIDKAFKLLESNPKYPSLKSHKALTKNYDWAWSSFVDNDIRIIWRFNKDEIMLIDLLDIGSHSGSYRIYK